MQTVPEDVEIWGTEYEALPHRPVELDELAEWYAESAHTVYVPVEPEPLQSGSCIGTATVHTRSEFLLRSDVKTVMCRFGWPEIITGEMTVTRENIGWRRNEIDITDEEFNDWFLSATTEQQYRLLERNRV